MVMFDTNTTRIYQTIDLITEIYNNITCEYNQLACVWKINPGSSQVCVYMCYWFLSVWTKSGRTQVEPGLVCAV